MTKENLELAHANFAGYLSQNYPSGSKEPLSDTDLTTLRWLTAFFHDSHAKNDQLNEKGKSLLILKGYGSDYSTQLSNLLGKRGLRVLLMPIYLDTPVTNQNELPGLLQCLEGEAAFPKIRKDNNYDIISAGGVSRYAYELIGSDRFEHLMQKLKEQYDLVIAISKVSPNNPEIAGLVDIFDQVAITVCDETIDEISPALTAAKANPNKKIAFILDKFRL